MNRSIYRVASLMLGLWMLAMPPAWAEQNTESPSGDAGDLQSDLLNDQNLRRFATAFGNVRALSSEYYEAIASARTEAEAVSLQNEVRERMDAAVESAGLTIEEYNYIAVQVSDDPDLYARIQGQM